MTFDARETSRSLGTPRTLIKFSYQNQMYAYTDNERAIVHDSVTYAPIPLRRDSITASGSLDKAALNITLPHDNPVCDLFKVAPPSERVVVTVFQGHLEEAEYLAVWIGRVLSCARSRSEGTLRCEPASTSMRRPGLRRRYQYGCSHALYGPQCRAVREDFTVTPVTTYVSGARIGFANGWNGAFAEMRFAQGLFSFTDAGITHYRTILQVDQALNRILVTGVVPDLIVGSTVSLSLGCNHLEDGCNVFDNIQNFGGMPWIPTENPLGQKNIFT